MAISFADEPLHDEAVQQHGNGRGPLRGAACPALRLFKTQMRLAVVERNLSVPFIIRSKITLFSS